MRLRRDTLLAVALSALGSSQLVAQSAPTSAEPNAIMFQFARFADIFGSRLATAFDSIPAAKFDFRPTSTQQSVGYIAQHLENANYGLCERLGAMTHPRSAKDSLPDTVKARWPKDTLVARLKSSLRFCDDALDRVPQLDSPALASTLLAFETDLAEHYSQIATYMRLLGLVPPSALPPTPRAAIALPTSAMTPFVGSYEFAAGQALIVTLGDHALAIRSTLGGGAVVALPETPTRFFAKDADAQFTFTKDATGTVTGLVLHQYGRDRSATKLK